MNDAERILGELSEFKRTTIEGLKEIRMEVKEIRVEVKDIAKWRWKISGGLAVVIGLAELVNVLMKK